MVLRVVSRHAGAAVSRLLADFLPRKPETHLHAHEKGEDPQQGRTERREKEREIVGQAPPRHAASPEIPHRDIPGSADGEQAERKQREPDPADPRDMKPSGDEGNADTAQGKGQKEGRGTENIVQEPCRVRAEKTSLVHDGGIAAHRVIEARVSGIVREEAQQDQQCPEQEEKPEDFPPEPGGSFSAPVEHTIRGPGIPSCRC